MAKRRRKNREIDLEKGIQKCNKCGEWKYLDDFPNHRCMKYGKDTTCKECSLQKVSKYYREHLEEKKEYDKKYYEKNREKILKRAEEDRNNRKEEIRAWFRWYDKIPKRRLKKNHYNHVRRARMKTEETDITSEYLKELKENTIYCEECGAEMNNISYDPQQKSLDHIIPVSKGGKHMKDNVRYICLSCNFKKNQY